MPVFLRRALVLGLVFGLTAACASGPARPTMAPAGPPPSELNPVVVYGSRDCQHTRAALAWLRARNIPTTFRNVSNDPDALLEMQQRAQAQGVVARGIPVMEVRGRLLVGFEPAYVGFALED